MTSGEDEEEERTAAEAFFEVARNLFKLDILVPGLARRGWESRRKSIDDIFIALLWIVNKK